MEKIFDKNAVSQAIKNCKYSQILEKLLEEDLEIYISVYKKGESIAAPYMKEKYFQLVTEGSLSICFIRSDGSQYGLSTGGKDYMLGDMDLFISQKHSIYATAESELKAITIDEEKYRETLLKNADFLALIAGTLASKLEAITSADVAPTTLTERVLNYIEYNCKGRLKGLEKAALYLHCSSRQLQRILNTFEEEGRITKIGKGEYKML